MALQTYKNRVENKHGGNLKEYVHKQVRENLDKFLENSQYGYDVKIDGKTERIGIMTSNMSETYDGVLVLSKPNVLKMGTLFEWADDFWVVLKRTVRVIHESFYGEAYRCNVELKWVDDEGNLKTQKGYGKGRGFSAILVENKYTQPPIMTRDIDTPLTIATLRNLEFKQDMRFLFEGQPYRVTFVDSLSIDGMTILGMYDDLLQEGDDVENSLAAYSNYSIELDFERDIEVKIGERFEVTYNIIQNGVPVDKRDIILEVGPGLARIEDGNIIIPLKETDIPVIVKSKQNPTIMTNFVIHAGTDYVPENIYVVGPDKLAWDTTATYHLTSWENAEFIVDFPEKVKGTVNLTGNSVDISIKDKYAGTIQLTVLTNTEVYSKEIQIVTNGGI